MTGFKEPSPSTADCFVAGVKMTTGTLTGATILSVLLVSNVGVADREEIGYAVLRLIPWR